MLKFRANAPVTLPQKSRLVSGSRGYEGHVFSRQDVAMLVASVTGMGYRAAYRAVKATRILVGDVLFVRGAIGGHTGWCAIESK